MSPEYTLKTIARKYHLEELEKERIRVEKEQAKDAIKNRRYKSRRRPIL